KTLNVRPKQTLVVDGKRIAWIGNDRNLPREYHGIRSVDGKGAFATPGLIDSHIHFNSPYRESRLMLGHGVTSGRDMGGTNATRLYWRAKGNSGELNGFSFITAGVILDGDPPYHQGSRACGNVQQAELAVVEQAKLKVDFLKVYSNLSLAAYQAIAKEANRRKMSFDGHIPNSVSMLDAARAGQRSMEHFYRLESLLSKCIPEFKPVSGEFELGAFNDFSKLDQSKLKTMLSELAASKTVICPTLILSEGQARMEASKERLETWRKYVAPGDLEGWLSKVPEQYMAYGNSLRRGFSNMGRLLKIMDDAKVPVVVGTDLGNGYAMAGRAMWDEMEHWERAGIAPGRILQCATMVPASKFTMRGHGHLSVGGLANFVLLNENPLKGVKALRSIQATCAQGRFFDREGLDVLLEEARNDLQRDMVSKELVNFEPTKGQVISSGTADHLFGPYTDYVESFSIRQDGATTYLRDALNMTTFNRVPLVIEAAKDARLNWLVKLRTHAVLPTTSELLVGSKQDVQFLLTPSLAFDSLQLSELSRLKSLPNTLRVLHWRNRQDLLPMKMKFTTKQVDGKKVIKLVSQSDPGFSVTYLLDDTGQVVRRDEANNTLVNGAVLKR
ncbi:MAG: amidohydrolase family protein, partial [Chlorobia bacterium]|nr:amidohydrolase family protein [Fimbriimonadaceae bacterium]